MENVQTAADFIRKHHKHKKGYRGQVEHEHMLVITDWSNCNEKTSLLQRQIHDLVPVSIFTRAAPVLVPKAGEVKRIRKLTEDMHTNVAEYSTKF